MTHQQWKNSSLWYFLCDLWTVTLTLVVLKWPILFEGQFLSLGMCLGVFIQGILPYPKVRLVPSKPFFITWTVLSYCILAYCILHKERGNDNYKFFVLWLGNDETLWWDTLWRNASTDQSSSVLFRCFSCTRPSLFLSVLSLFKLLPLKAHPPFLPCVLLGSLHVVSSKFVS